MHHTWEVYGSWGKVFGQGSDAAQVDPDYGRILYFVHPVVRLASVVGSVLKYVHLLELKRQVVKKDT